MKGPAVSGERGKGVRWIVHLDMDAFFVSVERLLDPSLSGKPVVVGGDPDGRGVVASASYEARRYGIRSAMPSRQARRLCPETIFLRGHHHLYGEYHRKARAILERCAPVVEGASIDEFYLDFSGCTLLFGAIPSLLRNLCRTIADELGLPSSAGLGTNKLVAKIASGLAKPNGVFWIPAGAEADFLAPLPVRILPGVGPATEKKLRDLGISRISHLASFPERLLVGTLGKWGEELARKSRGVSDATVSEGGERKSVGHEVTFREDSGDPAFLGAVLCRLAEKAAWRLRADGRLAGGVSIKVRYADFRTITRHRSLPPTDRDGEIFHAARNLLAGALARRVRIRLVGISLDGLTERKEQFDLFDVPADRKKRLLFPAVDRLRKRFGFDVLTLATGTKTP